MHHRECRESGAWCIHCVFLPMLKMGWHTKEKVLVLSLFV